MVYFTHARLMRESEVSVQSHAEDAASAATTICAQLIANEPRYLAWRSFHDKSMLRVADGRVRERQLKALRMAAIEQIHRAALVRHLRNDMIRGEERSLLLREFYGTLDTSCAVIAEHRAYTRAVSSQVCAQDILGLCNDRHGLAMLSDYEREFATYFAMHCDRMRAIAEGRPYLLTYLIPEVKADVAALRNRITRGDRLPIVSVHNARRPPQLTVLSHKLISHEPEK